ncbi:hypothetical protein EJB05_08845, partial [Eragrostis curvula]
MVSFLRPRLTIWVRVAGAIRVFLYPLMMPVFPKLVELLDGVAAGGDDAPPHTPSTTLGYCCGIKRQAARTSSTSFGWSVASRRLVDGGIRRRQRDAVYSVHRGWALSVVPRIQALCRRVFHLPACVASLMYDAEMAKGIAVPVGANSDINTIREHAGDQSSEDNDSDHVSERSEEELIYVGMINLLDGFLQFAKANCSRYPMNHSDKSTKCGPSILKDIGQPDISAGSGYSKNSVEYFAGVIQSLTPQQRNVIKDHGFGSLLVFDHCSVPKRFAKWICRHVDVEASEIKLGDKLIPICKESVNIVTGLPIGGDEVTLNREAGMAYLLSKFQLSDIPPVTYFMDNLRCADLSDEMILSCFAIVALSSFLAPNHNRSYVFADGPHHVTVCYCYPVALAVNRRIVWLGIESSVRSRACTCVGDRVHRSCSSPRSDLAPGLPPFPCTCISIPAANLPSPSRFGSLGVPAQTSSVRLEAGLSSRAAFAAELPRCRPPTAMKARLLAARRIDTIICNDVKCSASALSLHLENQNTTFESSGSEEFMDALLYLGSYAMIDKDIGVQLHRRVHPCSSLKPSPKYLSVLENIYDLLMFDWSKLVYDWLMKRIYKFNNNITHSGKSCKPLGGCLYFIAVYYLDFVNFGVHYVPRGIPRIKVWRGDMIKSYSKRDQINGRTFGKRPIKDLLNTCYAKIEPISQNFCSGHPNMYCYNISEFQAKLEASFGHCLPSEVKSSFCSLLEGINSRNCNSCHQKADSVILSVLQILSDAASNVSANSEQGTPSLTQDPSKKSLCDNFSASKDHNNLPSNGLVSVKEVAPNISSVDPGLGSVPSNIQAQNVSKNIAPSNDKRQIECSNSRSCTPTIILESSDDNSQKESSPQPMSKFNGAVNAKSGTEADIDELVIAAKNNTKLSHSQDKKIESPHEAIDIVTEKFIHSQPEGISNVMERCCTPIIKRRKLNKQEVNKNSATTSMIQPIHLFKINESDEEPVNGCPIQYGNFVQPQENVLSQTSKKCHMPSLKQKSPEVKIVGEKKFSDRNLELMKLSDNLYNNMISNDGAINMKKADPLARIQRMLRPKSSKVNPMFIPTANEIRYYDILCSLAYSQWSSQPGVKFGKSKRSTTVTYGSIGESVEQQGHVDSFFIAGYCRKFFEDRHLSTTKKHYCYPHVGYALLTYNGDSDLKVVEHCFKGANSAHKLHLTNMMLFPIVTGGHWFLFVVDFENKIFAFLDSIFGKADEFQRDARNKLIPAFKEAWYKHAEVKISLEDFHYYYPTVPKQDNSDDCGIFVIAFMELWKYGLDLTKFFSQADISNLRIKFANNLFFSKTNLIDKSLVQNFFNEGIDPRICK